MNKDRGTIKWNAMMLPEHVKLLREWQAEDSYVSEPQMDDYAFEELAHQIEVAVNTQCIVRVDYWHNGTQSSLEGVIQQLPIQTPYLTVMTDCRMKKVYIPHIIRFILFEG